ncbi:MAG: hemolysin family protein [Ignavibacteria bacterium]
MIPELILLIIMVIMSAFFSAAEISFVVANRLKFEIKARKQNFAAITASYFFKNTQIFFSTILISINIVQIIFGSMCALFFAYYFHYNDWTILIIETFALLIFGELLPKYFAREMADSVLMFSAVPVRLISFILFPIVKVTALVSDFLTKSESLKEENINLLFNREEIQNLLVESKEAGAVNKKETDILTRMIDLGDKRVYEVMRPRTDIAGVEINFTIEQALDTFIESGYSKLPVFEENLDNIKGVVFARDLFNKPESLQSITRNVIFVPETKKSAEMLKEFSKKRISFAVVVDEFGGTAGIMTMEDILEELLGEIRDEFDTDDEICKKISENKYVIGGKTEVGYINGLFNIGIPEGDYTTIGGFITSYLGRIPVKGEEVIISYFKILIIRSNQTRIELVKIILADDQD